MRPNSTPSRPRRLVSALLLAAMTVVTLAACSASGNTAAQDAASSRPTAPAAASATATSSTSAPPAPTAVSTTAPGTASGLSGTWTGQYSGSYSGTFTLRWQATGSQLSGTIHLSLPDTDAHITGTVAGGSIQFGTVGSGAAITYSGTVSGNSMSGTYQVHDTQGSTGPWSATKSS